MRIAEAGGEDLFGTRSILVISEADAIGDAVDAVGRGHPEPGDRPPPGRTHGSAILKQLKKAADTTIDCQPLKKGRALTEFVGAEFRRHKRRITSDALVLLIEAVGTDLADLSSAAHQLAWDSQTDPIDADVVGQYFRGVAELSGYQVADAVMVGHPAEVLQRLRQAQIAADGARTGPAIVAAVAGSVRQLIALSACPPGLSDADVARQVGAPPGRCGFCDHRPVGGRQRSWRRRSPCSPTSTPGSRAGCAGEQLDAAQKVHALERDLIALAVD